MTYMPLDDFDVLTFDCYGTMIDWETGITQALTPIFERHGASFEAELVMARFGELETAAEHGAYVEYREVLRRVLDGLGGHFGFAPSSIERDQFADSVKVWPPFADSARALEALHTRYKLAVISNVDDDLFAASARQLETTFDWVITAQQVRSYKPSPRNFLAAFDRIGAPRHRILHVAQSLFHDIAPASSLGVKTVWVDRRRGMAGTGATPPADATPDLIVTSLDALAQHAG